MKRILLLILSFSLCFCSVSKAQLIKTGVSNFETYYDSLFKESVKYFVDKKDDVEALHLLKKINSGFSRYDEVQVYKLTIEFEKRNYDEVERLIQQMKANNSQDLRTMNFFAGKVCWKKNELEKAITYFKANMALSENRDIDNQYYLAVCYLALSDFEKAEKEIIAFLRREFEFMSAHSLLAEIYLKQGRLSEALLTAAASAILNHDNSNFKDAYLLLEQIAKMRENHTDYFLKRTDTTAMFYATDRKLAAKYGQKKSLEVKLPNVELDWINYLEEIMAEHKYNDAQTFVHQYYLPILENFNHPKLEYLACFLFRDKIEEANFILNKYPKLNDSLLDYKQYVHKTVLINNDDTSMLYDHRKGKTTIKRISNFISLNKKPIIRVIELAEPIDIVVVPLLGRKNIQYTVYVNGYKYISKSGVFESSDMYYFYSHQLKDSYKYSSKDKYSFVRYNRHGQKIMDELYEQGRMLYLTHFNHFGVAIRRVDNTNPYYSIQTIYYNSGAVKEVTKGYPKGKKSLKNADTSYVYYNLDGSISNYSISDFGKAIVHSVEITGNKRDSIVVSPTHGYYFGFVNSKLQSKQTLEFGKSEIKIEYNDNGKIASQYISSISGKSWVREYYRPNGALYGYVKVENLKLEEGYMLSPKKDTLWSSRLHGNALKTYNEDGFLLTQQGLTHDGYLKNERYTYYLNGVVCKLEIFSEDANGKYVVKRGEFRYPNGNVEKTEEMSEPDSIGIINHYTANGRLDKTVKFFKPNYYNKEEFFESGMLYNKSDFDKGYGPYGDVKFYDNDGKLSRIWNLEFDAVYRFRYFINNSLAIDKYLNKGFDSIVIVDNVRQYYEKTYFENGVEVGMSYSELVGNKVYENKYYSPTAEKFDSTVRINKLMETKSVVKSLPSGGSIKSVTSFDGNLLNEVYYGTDKYTYNVDHLDGGLSIATKYFQNFKSILDIQICYNNDTLFKYETPGFGLNRVKYINDQKQTAYKRFSEHDTLHIAYYANGEVLMHLPVKNHVIHGNLKIFYDNGNLCFEGTFKDGYVHGSSKWYNKDGTLNYHNVCMNGAMAEELIESYSKTGKLQYKGSKTPNGETEIYYWDDDTQQYHTFKKFFFK